MMKIIVTGGAIVRDHLNRILFQKRSDYGDWGLPGGGMMPGESIEETMKREVFEETGLLVTDCELHSIYSGPRMEYTYPDGNEVTFVMFIFNAKADLQDLLMDDGKTLKFNNCAESLRLEFMNLADIDITKISTVQRPLIEDLKNNLQGILRM